MITIMSNHAIGAPETLLITEAKRCVKCALCLPHCPTYGLSRNEADSPRGRIALIQALAEGTLEPDIESSRYLDGCLDCRACEAVCPAEVRYGRLIDGARADLFQPAASWLTRSLRQMATRPRLLAGLLPPLRILAHLPLPPRLRGWRAYLAALKRLHPLPRGPAEAEPIALFLGCVARALDTEAIEAGVRLLIRAGYRVDVPHNQTCCGALANHAGKRPAARKLAARNAAAFADSTFIVATASGCTAQLSEYSQLLEAGESFSRRVRDITELLADALESGRLQAHEKSPLKVALHIPCTARNVLHSNAARRCLLALPNIEIIELPATCCGAAGSHFIDHPDDAAQLRACHIEVIRNTHPDYVVTTNVGCRLHLGAGLDTESPLIPIVHLNTLLANRIEGE